MSRRVLIRPTAKLDIVDQACYYADKAGLELAVRYQQAVRRTFQLLAEHPHVGKPSRIRRARQGGLREFPVLDFTSYLVFYRPTARGIEVLRVRHGARDLGAGFEF